MRLSLFLFSALALSACNYYQSKVQPTKGSGPPPAELPLNFATIQTTVIKPYCLGCHSGDTPRGGVSLDHGYQGLIDDGLVIPKDVENSLLYSVIKDGFMPPKARPQPSSAEVEVLMKWIDSGASEN
jgi:hypothetical protein